MTDQNQSKDFQNYITSKISELSNESFQNTGFVLLTMNVNNPMENPNLVSNIEIGSLKRFLQDLADGLVEDDSDGNQTIQ